MHRTGFLVLGAHQPGRAQRCPGHGGERDRGRAALLVAGECGRAAMCLQHGGWVLLALVKQAQRKVAHLLLSERDEDAAPVARVSVEVAQLRANGGLVKGCHA